MNKLITRIFWFLAPLLIGLLSWMVVGLNNTATEIKIARTEGNEREKLQEKIWDMVQINNQILESKADKKNNEDDHKLIIQKIDAVENSVNSILINKIDYSLLPKLDTVNFIVYELYQKSDSIFISGIYKEPSMMANYENK